MPQNLVYQSLVTGNFPALGATTQTWTVPSGVTAITITARGTDGVNAASNGGEGARIQTVSGDVYEIVVGQAGEAREGRAGTGFRNDFQYFTLGSSWRRWRCSKWWSW